jgi:hypothetical protein
MDEEVNLDSRDPKEWMLLLKKGCRDTYKVNFLKAD